MMKLQVKLLSPEGKIPAFAHSHDAGMDIFASESTVIPPGCRVQIKTGIAVAVPDGCVGLIWDKSGLSHRIGLKVLGGVIDATYRGELLIGLVNLGSDPHTVERGDKIAQMLLQKIEHPDIVIVDFLDETPRGENGFGSTGK
jgi:dUTP pyrophosphatase